VEEVVDLLTIILEVNQQGLVDQVGVDQVEQELMLERQEQLTLVEEVEEQVVEFQMLEQVELVVMAVQV
jgi:hypothetical protein